MRIKKHPIIDFEEKKKIVFYLDSKKLEGFIGDTIGSALHANGVRKLTTSMRYESSRGFFCGIGKCSSCLMRVNGTPNIRTCIAPLKKDIRVERQGKFADLPDAGFEKKSKGKIRVDVLVVGAGPAGLEASISAAKQGASVVLVDENLFVGGQLVKQTHKFFGSKNEKAGTRGIQIAKDLEEEVKTLSKNAKIKVFLDSTVIGYYEKKGGFHKFGVVKRKDYSSVLYEVDCKSVVFAVGAMENMLLFPGNDLPGVYGAGAVQTLMNVYGVKPGDRVVMVGAGNVGLIVSYQLLQAGISVVKLVEAAPVIGGYHVHAAKLRRCGVPILTSHSVKEVFGNERVEGCVIHRLDDKWQPVEGSEEKIVCDTVCLAVGLTPSTRLLAQVGVDMDFVGEAGGYIAIHDKDMQTSVENVFVAGDASGIEEASTAMIEGKIAGLAAAEKVGFDKNSKKLKKQYYDEIKSLRAGPFGEKPRVAKEKIDKLVRREKK